MTERDSLGRFYPGHKFASGGERGWFKKGSVPWIKGRGHSKITREKMRNIHLKRLDGAERLGDIIYQVKCPVCGKKRAKTRQGWLEIERGKRTNKCFQCMSKTRPVIGGYKKGNKPWNQGISKASFSDRIKHTAQWKEMREKVFKRDNYTCVICNKRGGQLHPDHILPKSRYPELVFELGNIRTLCVPCHRDTDTYGAKSSARNW